MKKLFYRLLLLIVIMACVMPFVIKDRYGQPLMSLADLKIPSLPIPGKEMWVGLINKSDDKPFPIDNEPKNRVYRWQDDQGIWHFSDKVNPNGQSELVVVQFNANVTEVVAEKPEEQMKQSGPNVEKLLETGAIPLFNAVEILEQAGNIEGLLQQRYQRQEEALSRK